MHTFWCYCTTASCISSVWRRSNYFSSLTSHQEWNLIGSAGKKKPNTVAKPNEPAGKTLPLTPPQLQASAAQAKKNNFAERQVEFVRVVVNLRSSSCGATEPVFGGFNCRYHHHQCPTLVVYLLLLILPVSLFLGCPCMFLTACDPEPLDVWLHVSAKYGLFEWLGFATCTVQMTTYQLSYGLVF